MSDPDGPAASQASTNLDSLTGRFVGSLLLLGGAVLLAIAEAIRQLPTAVRDGSLVYILPTGGRHGLEPFGTLVLAAAGTLLVILGLAGLALGRLSARRLPRPAPVTPSGLRRPRHPSRSMRTLAMGAAALAAVLIVRWFSSRP